MVVKNKKILIFLSLIAIITLPLIGDAFAEDTTPPMLFLTGAIANEPIPQIVNRGDTYKELGATCYDAIDGDLTSSIVIDSSEVDTTTLGSYKVIYDCTDLSGNNNTEIRPVNVISQPSKLTVTVKTIGDPAPNDSLVFHLSGAGAQERVGNFFIDTVNNKGTSDVFYLDDGVLYILQINQFPADDYEFESFSCTADGKPLNYNKPGTPTRVKFWANNDVQIICNYQVIYTGGPTLKVIINTDTGDDTSFTFGLRDRHISFQFTEFVIPIIDNTSKSAQIQLIVGHKYNIQQLENNLSYDFDGRAVCTVNGVGTYFSDTTAPLTRTTFVPQYEDVIICTYDYTRNSYTPPTIIKPPTLKVIVNTNDGISGDDSLKFNLNGNNFYVKIVDGEGDETFILEDGKQHYLQQHKIPAFGYEFESFDCTANGESVEYHGGEPLTRATFWASYNVDVVCIFTNTYSVPEILELCSVPDYYMGITLDKESYAQYKNIEINVEIVSENIPSQIKFLVVGGEQTNYYEEIILEINAENNSRVESIFILRGLPYGDYSILWNSGGLLNYADFVVVP